jgi:hypothetical protein
VDRDTTRRRFLASMAAGTVVGVAGCFGGDGSADGDAAGSTATSTATDTTTPTAAASSDPFCAPLTGTATAYDTAGTPFVFSYDYVDSWTVEEPFTNGGSRAQRVVSPTLTNADGDESDATVRVAQSLSPVTADEAAETTQFLRDNQEDNGVTYETEFNGETVEFVEFPNVDVRSYNTHLPYGDGEARYYSFSIVTLLDGGGPGQNISRCTDAVNVATRTTLDSIAPNHETTIDEV